MSATPVHHQSGYTLVEMAAVLIIAGLILAAAASAAIPIIKEARIVGTQGKIDKIARAIDFYATQNYRVPCPATPNIAVATEPFGYESGSGAAGAQVPPSCTLTNGIIPWKTLGLPSDLAIDAWGNYITYAISPAFSLDTTQDIPVHAACRTADWYTAPQIYEETNTGPSYPYAGISVYVHRNPRKARFCCPYPNGTGGAPSFPPATDLVINDASGNPQLAISRSTGAQPETAFTQGATTALTIDSTKVPYYLNPATSNQITSNAILDENNRPTAPVYVLVSHGANGYGAYNVNTGVRGSLPGTITAGEKANAGGVNPQTFYEVPAIDRTTANIEKGYDDVVLWRTQDLIFASQGQSCAAP